MTEKFKFNLSRMWLLTSIVILILPVFLPSYANPQNFLQNVIGTTTVTMFILSFPSSLFGIPILFFTQITLGVDPNTIGGMYLNLFLLFILGLVQWFWIVPRLWQGTKDFNTLSISNGGCSKPLLPDMKTGGFEFFDRHARTPLERVLNDEDGDSRKTPCDEV